VLGKCAYIITKKKLFAREIFPCLILLSTITAETVLAYLTGDENAVNETG
jgi:hypothetical protein